MPFKIAAASSDGKKIDLHFGQTSDFTILTLSDSGELTETETRRFEFNSEPVSEQPEQLEQRRRGGCKGAVRVNPRIHKAAELLSDCEFLLAESVGSGAERQLAGKGITAFAVSGSITDATEKIIAFKKRQKNIKRRTQQ